MNAWSIRAFVAGVLLAAAAAARADSVNPFASINHFVVIYTENRSLDGLFADFPGADGFNDAHFAPQVDTDGSVLKSLPHVWLQKGQNDPNFPDEMPNRPFAIDDYEAADVKTVDLVHKFYQQQEQIDGGSNDRFAAVSDAGGLAMGHYRGASQRLWRVAKDFTLADHFHHAAFGGSFLNHFWLICACTPKFDSAPRTMRAVLDDRTGFLARRGSSPKTALDGAPEWVNDGALTPDGYAVNTVQPTYMPYSDKAPAEERLPPQTMPTIGDRLTAKGITWAWYAGGWSDAQAGRLKPYKQPEHFQPHHQPFNYFAAFAPAMPARAEHLKDASDMMLAIASGNLRAVSFYKPLGKQNLHPGYGDLASGDAHVADVVAAIQRGPNWRDTAIIITADENGGYWDHVAPPKGDRWGPGLRVPTLVISPFAKRGFVDHTVYDTTSILRTLEVRYDLQPLAERDAKVADLRNAFEGAPATH